jgi:hypothetical protein
MSQKLVPPKSCANCGARVLPGAASCGYCHQPIEWEAAPPAPTSAGMSKGVLVVALVLAGAGMLAVAAVGFSTVGSVAGSGQPATSSAPAAPSSASTAVADQKPEPPTPAATVNASPAPDADVGGGKGQLSQEVIRRIMRGASGAFRACYERGLASNPKLAGKVDVHFVIGLDGSVRKVTTSGSTLTDKGVLRCIAARVSATRFPSPGGDTVEVTYPIIFASQ